MHGVAIFFTLVFTAMLFFFGGTLIIGPAILSSVGKYTVSDTKETGSHLPKAMESCRLLTPSRVQVPLERMWRDSTMPKVHRSLGGFIAKQSLPFYLYKLKIYQSSLFHFPKTFCSYLNIY